MPRHLAVYKPLATLRRKVFSICNRGTYLYDMAQMVEPCEQALTAEELDRISSWTI